VTTTTEHRRAIRTITVDPPRYGTVTSGPQLRRLAFQTAFVAGAGLAVVGLGLVTFVRWIRA